MLLIVTYLLTEKKSVNLRLVIKNNFPSRFCLGNISNEFDHVDSEREMGMIFQLIVVLLINITF